MCKSNLRTFALYLEYFVLHMRQFNVFTKAPTLPGANIAKFITLIVHWIDFLIAFIGWSIYDAIVQITQTLGNKMNTILKLKYTIVQLIL